MKNIIVLTLLVFPFSILSSQSDFSKWFSEGSLRVDYILAGNDSSSDVYLQTLKKEPFWGGSETCLIDTFAYGDYLCQLLSEDSSEIIFSTGFSTLFQEWQTTQEAKQIKRGFFQSTSIPFPKTPVLFQLSERNGNNQFEIKLSIKINPSDYFIIPSDSFSYKVEKIKISGPSSHSVDIVFIPEGYTENQMNKFISDISRLTDSLFSVKPFSDYSEKFNLYAVLAPSLDAGCDIPGKSVWKNTLVNSSFYTFDSERYLTTLDFWKVKDIASAAPYDQIYILVNTDKYGGGGIYNHYNLTSSDNSLSPHVFIHEFGHGFAGLGDEYYTSDVSYSEFYSPLHEPWEPNLTNMVDFSKKWRNLIEPGTPVPTPETPEYDGSVGVFEGGGYVLKGVYRPSVDCRMKSNKSGEFCKVCQISIEKKILFMTR